MCMYAYMQKRACLSADFPKSPLWSMGCSWVHFHGGSKESSWGNLRGRSQDRSPGDSPGKHSRIYCQEAFPDGSRELFKELPGLSRELSRECCLEALPELSRELSRGHPRECCQEALQELSKSSPGALPGALQELSREHSRELCGEPLGELWGRAEGRAQSSKHSSSLKNKMFCYQIPIFETFAKLEK